MIKRRSKTPTKKAPLFAELHDPKLLLDFRVVCLRKGMSQREVLIRLIDKFVKSGGKV